MVGNENNKISFGTLENKDGNKPSNWPGSEQSTVKNHVDVSASLFNS